jgi:hypothetical protein
VQELEEKLSVWLKSHHLVDVEAFPLLLVFVCSFVFFNLAS